MVKRYLGVLGWDGTVGSSGLHAKTATAAHYHQTDEAWRWRAGKVSRGACRPDKYLEASASS